MRKRIVSIFGSLALLVSVAVPVSAGQPVKAGGFSVLSCSEAQVNAWENTGFNGNGLAICYNVAIPNFGTLAFPGGGTWDNKISSAEFDEKTVNTRACMYTEVNYIGNIWNPQSDASIQWFFGGDVITSFRYVGNFNSC